MNKINYKRLSKFLSLVLRHKPELLDLTFDEDGFTTIFIDELVKRMQKYPHWKELTTEDIYTVVENDTKGRFEIKNQKIRARYGHSIPVGSRMWLQKKPADRNLLPKLLYHGTTRKAAEKILKEGLLPQYRQFVHLSPTIEWAHTVGKRHTKRPTILIIDTDCALKKGVKMWIASKSTILATPVPSECIRIHSG